MMYLIENTFSLKKYKPRVMRLQGFMGIRSLAKQIQSSFNKSSDTIGPFIRGKKDASYIRHVLNKTRTFRIKAHFV